VHAKDAEELVTMSKGERHGNREAKKPKKEKPKILAAAPSAKGIVSTKFNIGLKKQ
jgi:ribosomal protein S12